MVWNVNLPKIRLSHKRDRGGGGKSLVDIHLMTGFFLKYVLTNLLLILTFKFEII